MKKFIHGLAVIFLIFLLVLGSKSPLWSQTYEWIRTTENPGSVTLPNSLTADGFGNVIAGGLFNGTLSFGSASVSVNQFSLYYAKFDSMGNSQWLLSASVSPTTSIDAIVSCTDPSGNFFQTEPTIGQKRLGNLVVNPFNAGNEYYPIGKVSSSGVPQWLKTLEPVTTAPFFGIANLITDGSGDLYIYGYLNDQQNAPSVSLRYDGQLIPLSTKGGFLMKISSSGTFQWLVSTLPPGINGATISQPWPPFLGLPTVGGFAFSQGLIHVLAFVLLTNGITTLRWLRYNTQGNLITSSLMVPDAGILSAVGLSINSSNEVLFFGGFNNLAPPGTPLILQGFPPYTPLSSSNFFLAKYNSSGQAVWFRHSQGNVGASYKSGLNNQGEVILFVGHGGFSFGNFTTTGIGQGVLKVTSSGAFDWYKPIPFNYFATQIALSNSLIYVSSRADSAITIDGIPISVTNQPEAWVGKLGCGPPAISQINGPTSVCVGTYNYRPVQQTANAQGITYTWQLSGGGTISPGTNQATVTWTSAGVHTLTATPVNNCKPGTPFSIQVEVTDVPAAPPITGDSMVCIGQAFYQTNPDTTLTYQWSLSGGGVLTSLGNSASVSWSGQGSHVLSIRATNQCGQGPSRNLPIEVLTLPVQPSPIAGSSAVCPGAQAYSVTPSPGVQYLWNLSGGGSFTSIQNAATVNWSTAGSYILTVIPENLCGAGPARNLVVSANEPPAQPATLIGDASPCLGLESYSVLALPGVSYQWNLSGGGGLIASGASAQVAWAAQGLHSLSVTPVNVCGAGPARVAVVQVNDIPTQPGPIQGLDSVCLGAQLYGINQIPGVNYIWALSGGGALTSGGPNASVNWTIPGFHSVSVTPINGCGTGPSRTKSVFVRNTGSQTGAITGDSAVCVGSTEPYAVSVVPGFSYQWSLSGGGAILASGPLATVAWSQPGLHFIQVLTSDGCVSGKPVQVNAAPSPLPLPAGPDTVCTGIASFSTQFIPGISYIWSLNGGGLLSPSFHTANVQFQTPGSWVLSVQALDACGSSLPSVKQVEVIAPPTQPLNFPPRDTLCVGVLVFNANPSPGNSVFWSLTGPVSVQANGNPVNLSVQDTGSYVLQVNEANNCGSGPAVNQLLRIIRPPRPPLIQLPAQACIGDTIIPVFTNRSFPEDETMWSFSGPVTAVGSGNTLRLVCTGVGPLKIRFFAQNHCGTSLEDSATVQILGQPAQPAPIQGNSVTCLGIQPYHVTFPGAGQTTIWQLSGGGNLSSNGTNAFVGWATPGIHTLRVAYTNACATGSFRDLTVTVNSTPSQPVPVQWPTAICSNGATFAVAQQSGVNYLWNAAGSAQVTSSDAQATVIWPATGQFILSITPENACGIGLAYTQTVAVDGSPETPVLIAGDTLLCAGPMRYEVLPSLQPSGIPATYQWIGPQGISLTDSLNTTRADWTRAGRYILAVVASNGCGTSDTARFTVKVDSLPAFSASISGLPGICLGNALYSVQPSDEEHVLWSVHSGGVFTATGSVVRVSWQRTGPHLITAVPANACGLGKADSLTVTVYDIPQRLPLIDGPAELCSGNSMQYLAPNPDGVSLIWEASGGTLLNASDSSARVRWDSEGIYNLIVTPQNLCGQGPQTQKTVRVDQVPSAPVFLEGDSLTCEGLTPYRVTASGLNLDWIWEISSGGDLTALSNQALVNWLADGDFILRVLAQNTCGSGPATDLSVQVVASPVTPELVRRGDSIFAVPSVGTQWYFNDEPLTTTGQPFIIPVEDGVFSARNTNLCGVSFQSEGILVAEFFQGVPRRPFLYPNPASEQVTVQIPPYLGWDRIRIIDLLGHTVDELKNTGVQRFDLSISQLAAGTYIFEFYTELLVLREKLIVE